MSPADESRGPVTIEEQRRRLSRRGFLSSAAKLAGGGALALALAEPGLARLTAAQTTATPSAGGNGPIPVNPQVGTAETTTILNPGVVSWVHFGDLHITTADQQNYLDFKTIIANTNQDLLNGVNFAVLPGDNANDGAESEYQLIKAATDQLKVPLYAVPGDHDYKTDIALYHKYLEPVSYQSFSAAGYHFVFLDVMKGIGSDEQAWATSDLDGAKAAGLKSVVIMHSYTAATELQALIQRDDVIMVDSGHTHYNDVANDGHTIYAAGRNTGQVTEGPVGFVIANIDNGVISWKFKPLGSWPFVMITSPCDKLLMIDGNQAVKGTVDVRTKIWDDKGVAAATYQIDGGSAQPLTQIGTTQMWNAPWDSTSVAGGDHRITVHVQGAGGNTASDAVTVVVNQAGAYQIPARSFGPSGNSIGAYADKGLLGNHTAAGGGAAKTGGGAKGGPGGGKGAATVVGVSGSVVTVQYADGTKQEVTVDSSTQITREASASLSDLKPGDMVTVQAAPSTSAGASGSAAPTAGKAGKGGPGGKGGHGLSTVVSVSGAVLTVRDQKGNQQQVTVDAHTQITKQTAASLSDLTPGTAVTVRASAAAPSSTSSATPTSGGAVTATQIDIQSASVLPNPPGTATPTAA